MLDRLKPPCGAVRKKRRVGRGEGSGWGKTAGKGTKGQNSRSGGGVKAGFEGGQMPLQRRLPKRGFTNIFKKTYSIINVGTLAERFKDGDVVDKEVLIERGLIKKKRLPLKVLGDGEINVALTVKADLFSKTAKEKIEACGGKVEVL